MKMKIFAFIMILIVSCKHQQSQNNQLSAANNSSDLNIDEALSLFSLEHFHDQLKTNLFIQQVKVKYPQKAVKLVNLKYSFNNGYEMFKEDSCQKLNIPNVKIRVHDQKTQARYLDVLSNSMSMPEDSFAEQSIDLLQGDYVTNITKNFNQNLSVAMLHETKLLAKLRRHKFGIEDQCHSALLKFAHDKLKDVNHFIEISKKACDEVNEEVRAERKFLVIDTEEKVANEKKQILRQMDEVNQYLDEIRIAIENSDDTKQIKSFQNYNLAYAKLFQNMVFNLIYIENPTEFKLFDLEEILKGSQYELKHVERADVSSMLDEQIANMQEAIVFIDKHHVLTYGKNYKKVEMRTAQYQALHNIGKFATYYPYAFANDLTKGGNYGTILRCGLEVFRDNEEIEVFANRTFTVMSLVPMAGTIMRGALAIRAIAINSALKNMPKGLGFALRSTKAVAGAMIKQSHAYYIFELPIFIGDVLMIQKKFEMRSIEQFIIFKMLNKDGIVSDEEKDKLVKSLQSLKWDILMTIAGGAITSFEGLQILRITMGGMIKVAKAEDVIDESKKILMNLSNNFAR